MLRPIARRVRGWLRMLARGRVKRTGQVLRDAYHFPSIEGSLSVLRAVGFRPQTCIDIGAFQGDWTRMFHSIFPESKVLMIDALESQSARLEEVSRDASDFLSYEIALLSSSSGKALAFYEMGTGSSVLEEASPYSRRSRTLMTQTLDDLVGHHPEFRRPDFLKLDTQGYELEILKGAGETLRASKAVLLEASLLPVNQGCPLISEIIAFMDSNGFNLYDFCSQNRRTDGVLWQTDLLFLNRDSAPLPDPELNDSNWC